MSDEHHVEPFPPHLSSSSTTETRPLSEEHIPLHVPEPPAPPAPPPQPSRSIKRNKAKVQHWDENLLKKLQPSAPNTKVHATSYQNLERVRQDAASADDPNDRYSSTISRARMTAETSRRCDGKTPQWFQTDVGEAFLLGMDVILVSGTGTGKTLAFLQPLLADASEMSKIIIISPLNLLEYDMVCGIYSPACIR